MLKRELVEPFVHKWVLRQGLQQLFELFGEGKRNRKASAESPARSGRPTKTNA